VDLDDAVGVIRVEHASEQSSLRVTVCVPRLDVLPKIIARVRRQFDLGAEPSAIASALSTDPILAPLVAARPGLRVPGGWDGFEVAVRAVLGQQITVKAATKLLARLVAKIGAPLKEERHSDGLTHVFPRAERFKVKALNRLVTPATRAKCLAGIATAYVRDPQLFAPRRDLEEAVSQFRSLSGVGEWTAQYIAMRALGESDAFLAADVGLRRGMARFGPPLTAKQALIRAQPWRPWRAYAMSHLWAAAMDQHDALVKEAYGALTA
jgi:AraC family transcriptional regulator of adaptative response / DNA-3-methyladenine glycosylase II